MRLRMQRLRRLSGLRRVRRLSRLWRMSLRRMGGMLRLARMRRLCRLWRLHNVYRMRNVLGGTCTTTASSACNVCLSTATAAADQATVAAAKSTAQRRRYADRYALLQTGPSGQCRDHCAAPTPRGAGNAVDHATAAIRAPTDHTGAATTASTGHTGHTGAAIRASHKDAWVDPGLIDRGLVIGTQKIELEKSRGRSRAFAGSLRAIRRRTNALPT
jgi:hypothetical protein